MCSKEELLRQLMEEASVLTDEEVEEVLEYARREFEAAVEEGKKEKKETWTAQYRQSVRLQSMRKMYTVLQVTSKRRDGNEV